MSPRFGDLDLPAKLDHALAEGELAIFAGAGVSVAPPSDLPSFDGLTAQIGEGSLPQRKDEPFELYLGRLKGEGVRVHDLASEILSNPASQPNDLHRAIASLWSRPADVRIVTTNFDPHLEAALSEKWPANPPEHWAAPALPVGSRFNGLVYLHGRLGHPDRLVLTDADFGRAYLTEGWAREFLTALFRHYVVLFVGYSHNDAIVKYLARGLPPASVASRFALTDQPDPERWRFLGVEPISYDRKNNHAALLIGLQRWGELRTRGTLTHQQEIGLLCASPPPIDREDADYLLWCVERRQLVHLFTDSAQGAEWFEWLHGEGRLSALLCRQASDVRQIRLLHWFAGQMCASAEAIERGLELLASPSLVLSDAAFRALAGALWRRVEGTKEQPATLDPSTAKAILFLLSRRPLGLRENAIDYLLKAITIDFADLALTVFDDLTRPSLMLEVSRPLRPDDPRRRTTGDVVVLADGHWIYVAWEGVLKQCLPTRANEILTIARHHLEHADRLMRAAGLSTLFDAHTHARVRMGEDDEDERAIRSHYPFYVLVHAARDAFEWLLANAPDRATAALLDWASSPATVVRRVAVYELSRAPAIPADARLALAVERQWLGDSKITDELLAFLAAAYPIASEASRTHLLDQLRETRIGSGPIARADDDDAERAAAIYRYYDVLTWLARAAPGCATVRERVAEVQAIHPELQARDPSESDFRIKSGWVQPASRHSVEEMLEWQAAEYLRRFAEEQSAAPRSWDTDWITGYLEEGVKAVASNFEWGYSLAHALLNSGEQDSPIWGYLLRGWQAARLPPEQWLRVIAFLQEHLVELPAVVPAAAELLKRRVEGDPADTPDEVILDCLELAHTLWDTCRTADTAAESYGDWLTTAINRPSGELAIFAMRSASILRERLADGWVERAPRLSELLHRMAEVDEAATPLARVVLCSQLHFLQGLDSEWTERALFPLFDWAHPDEAQRAWAGFLGWGRATARLWPHLKEMMLGTFGHLDGLGSRQSRFAEMVAFCSLFLMADSFDRPWLQSFVEKSVTPTRKVFADHLGGGLRKMGPQAADETWRKWLREYVRARLAGKPALAEEEWAAMQHWPLYMGEAFADAVDLVTQRAAHFSDSSMILYELSKRSPAPEPARSLAQFLLHLLRGQPHPLYESDLVMAICRRIGAAGDADLERALQELFVELGGAGTLFPAPGSDRGASPQDD